MSFSFEVKESDLLGRIGTLTVGGKKLETPCLFPVIHPVRESVSTKELASLGFKGLMTNSLIIYTRRRDEALAKGIHRLLDFDGIFMTDSGGYQVLEYGNVEVSYEQIAAFQSGIGSDLAVTLDMPTGYSLSKRYASETMEYSLKNALATMREFGGSQTAWIGPVQGGLFTGLLQESARKLLGGGFRFLALGSPTQVMESYKFAELVRMISATRKAVPYSVPLHLFGAGHPLTMAISVALGCDTFDSASYILFARQGRYMTGRGTFRLDQMGYLPCSCPTCMKTSVRDLREVEAGARSKMIAMHNLFTLRTEIETCKEAITEGRLWDLVEEKSAVHPSLLEAFHAFSKETDMLQAGTPALKNRGLLVRGGLDSGRPELRSAARMLSRAIKRDKKLALLIVGGESLPTSRLKIHVLKPKLADCEIYRVHPYLGAYPAELDFVYPFTQTVGTFSGDQSVAEAEARTQLKRMGYTRVVLAVADEKGNVLTVRVKNRPRLKAASPCPPST